jgi:lambda family phage portal protein
MTVRGAYPTLSAKSYSMATSAERLEAFDRAIKAVASAPVLYGPTGKRLRPTGSYGIRRESAGQKGSLKGWNPRNYFSSQEEARDREEVVRRSNDLIDNDPHAAGLVDTYASTVVGAGLVPHPNPDPDGLFLEESEDQVISKQMRVVYNRWANHADAGERLTFGQIQYLIELSMMRHGEYFVLLPMIDKPYRPYRLACQVIHPSRVKTPVDLTTNEFIRDGIELGYYGEPVAVWIKKSGGRYNSFLPDTKNNFIRQPMRVRHRKLVLHGYVAKDAEQVRGWPILAPAIKYFRSFNDLLDSELISNVITSALAYFIETVGGDDPFNLATRRATLSESRITGTGNRQTDRYEQVEPGLVMYGEPNQKPHVLAANRPGTTFDPFTKTVKKSLSLAANMPYVIGFKDYEETNFAGARMAMLDAWRVFTVHRRWLGSGACQPITTSLMEEAWLMGEIAYPSKDFYRNIDLLTACDWRGDPKGDIEPVKAAQADVMLIKNSLKDRAQAIIERGGDPRRVTKQLEEENRDLASKSLPLYGPEAEAPAKGEKPDEDE